MPSFSHVRFSGYALSMASTCLLAVPAVRGAYGAPLMEALVIGGVILSLTGIGMRWHSHNLERRDKGRR